MNAYDTTSATSSAVPASCLGISSDVWYSWTALQSGALSITNCGQSPDGFDTVIAVYSGGECAGLDLLACHDGGGSCGFDEAAVTLPVRAGTTYWVRFGSFESEPGQSGSFVASFLSPPENDTCAGAIELALELPRIGSTFGAANDYQVVGTFTGIGQASPAGAAGRDVAYTFTAPEADTYSFRLSGYAGGNAVLYLAQGCPIGVAPQTVTAVAGANRTTLSTAAAEEIPCVPLLAGQQVYLFVDETSSSGSAFRVEVRRCAVEDADNDLPAAADALVHGLQGAIAPEGDVDFISLGSVAAGSRIFAVVDGAAAAAGDLDLRVTTATDTIEFDDADNDAALGAKSPNCAGTPIAIDGEVFLRLSHHAALSTEPWTVHAVVRPAIDGASAEQEPNGLPTQAGFAVDGYHAGNIASSADADHFTLTALAGQVVMVLLDGDPLRDGTPVNAALALLNEAGELLASVDGAGAASSMVFETGSLTATTPSAPGEALLHRVASTGSYVVRVTAAEPGDYLLSITTMPDSGPAYCDAASAQCGEPASFIAAVAVAADSTMSGFDAGCYSDLTGGLSFPLARTIGATLTVTIAAPMAGDTCTAWCDWNLDGDFEDAEEAIALAGGPSEFTGSLVPPPTALLGRTRLRLRLHNSEVDPMPAPCGSAGSGEVEDHTVVVMPESAPPANDLCIDAPLIGTGVVGGTTVNATSDGSIGCPGSAASDVWYQFTAVNQGTLVVAACAPELETLVSIHAECGGAALACGTSCGSSECATGGACVSLPLEAGDSVLVRVASDGGAFVLALAFEVENDGCDGALPLAVPGSAAGSTAGASVDAAVPGCAGVAPSPGNHGGSVAVTAGGVWFRLIGDGSTVTADTLDSAYDTRLHVFTGGCGALTCVTANDDINALFRSKVAFQTVDGAEYLVLVSGFGSATGSFVLNVSSDATPSNDDCAEAQTIDSSGGSLEGTTVGATGEGFALNSVLLATCATSTADPLFDVWFRWTAPCDAPVVISTCGPFDTLLSVHATCPTISAGQQLSGACSDDAGETCGPGSQVSFAAVAGITYHVRVAGAVGAESGGEFALTVALPDADGDAAPDCIDECPLDGAKTSPGICGCGIADTDGDGDGVADCLDACPLDPFKVQPGQCGCGISDVDGDGDGVSDCNDLCPLDAAKVAPGLCGCGVRDLDSDGDQSPDCLDGCPLDPAKVDPGVCGCGAPDVDTDQDGAADCVDGCPSDFLKTAPGLCGCGVSDTDSDGDGLEDCHDGCPLDPAKVEPGQCGCGVGDGDGDGDGVVDCQDLCPGDPAKSDPGVCGCGTPDIDSDGDFALDCLDACPGYDDFIDCNVNAVPDGCDINVVMTSQDLNGNGIPDECDCFPDLNKDEIVDGADLGLLLVQWAFVGESEADFNYDRVVDGADLGILLAAWGFCVYGDP